MERKQRTSIWIYRSASTPGAMHVWGPEKVVEDEEEDDDDDYGDDDDDDDDDSNFPRVWCVGGNIKPKWELSLLRRWTPIILYYPRGTCQIPFLISIWNTHNTSLNWSHNNYPLEIRPERMGLPKCRVPSLPPYKMVWGHLQNGSTHQGCCLQNGGPRCWLTLAAEQKVTKYWSMSKQATM